MIKCFQNKGCSYFKIKGISFLGKELFENSESRLFESIIFKWLEEPLGEVKEI